MVSVLQYAENVSDRQAAEAVRCRLDWKYCLGLELDDPGFDFSVLSEFRDRMAQGDRADGLLAVMVEHLVAAGLVKLHGRMRTDSTHVLAAVRKLNRVELVAETLRALWKSSLRPTRNGWRPWSQQGGQNAMGPRPAMTGCQRRKRSWPRMCCRSARTAWSCSAPSTAVTRRTRLRDLPQVQVLRQVWIQQYWYDGDGQLCWRGSKDSHDRLSRRDAPRRLDGPGEGSPGIGAARVPWSSTEIVTPHDAEARFAHRPGKAAWIGYKDHQTETCDDAGPNVIVHVATQTAPEQDISVLESIHRALAERDLLPTEHLVDAGYATPAAILRASTDYAVTLLGPVRPGSPRLRRPGFDKQDFRIDWDQHTATCPRGVTSPPWNDTQIDGQKDHSVLFPGPPAGPARTGSRAPATPAAVGAICFLCPARCRRSRIGPAPNRKLLPGKPATQYARAARPPSPRPFTPTACATAAIAGWRRCTSSMS